MLLRIQHQSGKERYRKNYAKDFYLSGNVPAISKLQYIFEIYLLK